MENEQQDTKVIFFEIFHFLATVIFTPHFAKIKLMIHPNFWNINGYSGFFTKRRLRQHGKLCMMTEETKKTEH